MTTEAIYPTRPKFVLVAVQGVACQHANQIGGDPVVGPDVQGSHRSILILPSTVSE